MKRALDQCQAVGSVDAGAAPVGRVSQECALRKLCVGVATTEKSTATNGMVVGESAIDETAPSPSNHDPTTMGMGFIGNEVATYGRYCAVIAPLDAY
jgi:hypothetical protein